MTDFVIPDSITPIEAWRVWLYRTPHLYAQHSWTQWPMREAMRAECQAKRYSLFPHATVDGNHKGCPDVAQSCKCGIHAAETIEAALKRSNMVSHIVGRVALWGTVVECETGYRAEYAYPLELWLPYERKHPGTAAAIEAAYGVPVHNGRPE